MTTETMNDTGTTMPGIDVATNVVELPTQPSDYERYLEMLAERIIRVTENIRRTGVSMTVLSFFVHTTVTGNAPQHVSQTKADDLIEQYGWRYDVNVFCMYVRSFFIAGSSLSEIEHLVREGCTVNDNAPKEIA